LVQAIGRWKLLKGSALSAYEENLIKSVYKKY
jgi:hypothetical protein